MDLEQKSIERIQFASQMSFAHYGKPIVCTYSGGKDSDVMLELFKRSGVPFEVHNSHTTVDAPQTVYHIREKFKELESLGIKCEIEKPPINKSDPQQRRFTMWSLIVKKKMPPTRLARYCCAILKEGSCRNRMNATGVRWGESNARSQRGEYEVLGKTKKDRISLNDAEMTGKEEKPEYEQLSLPGTEDPEEVMLMNDNSKKRRFIEKCVLKAKTVCNPIIEWTDKDIWNFIESEKIKVNPLYQMGFCRVGCIGCPMADKARYFEFNMFPTYKRAYIHAFEKMLEALNADGTGRKTRWKTGEDVFAWWMEEQAVPGQMGFNDYEDLYL